MPFVGSSTEVVIVFGSIGISALMIIFLFLLGVLGRFFVWFFGPCRFEPVWSVNHVVV